MARKSSKTTPTVISNILYTDDPATGTKVGSFEWFCYLEDATKFYVDCGASGFTCRKEKMRNGYFWYAYKKVNGKLHKRYIGLKESIDQKRLQDIESFIRFSLK